MTTEMNNNNHNIDVIDDDLDEVSVPKLNSNPDITSSMLDMPDMPDMANMPDMSNFDFSKMFESLKSKDPKELTKMIRKMGINDSQIEQMKKQYKAGNMTTSEETDPRKRLRAKMNEMRMMRGSNNTKKQYMEEMESKGQQPQVIEQVSKKTLANRKKAQKKKDKKKSESGNQEDMKTENDKTVEDEKSVEIEEFEEIKCY
jgi:hypothetical protein